MTDIDHLEIEITSNATSAEKAIAKLANSLKTLKAACQGGAGLNGIAKGVESLANAANSIGSDAGTKLSQIANAIAKISVSGYVGNTGLDKLAQDANAVNPASANAVAALANALKPLTAVGRVDLSGMATGLADLGAAGDLLMGKDWSGIANLATALGSLSGMGKIDLSNMATGMLDISLAADLLQGKDLSPVKTLADAMSNFKGLSLTKTFVSNFEKLILAAEKITPEMATNLQAWADALEQVGKADLSGLADAMDRISNDSADAPSLLGNTKDDINKSAPGILASIQLIEKSMRATWSAIGGFVNKSNKYIEDVNLFTASLGKYAVEAEAYAQRVSEVMGIDPGQWMRYQGVFQTLSEGFGVVGDRAYIMSKNLTQLGYDISSFYNMDVNDAMLKLQSGLAGELEPLRRIGYDLSEARLKAIALSLGIKTAYKDMTQAEKSQLRYYAILTQVTTAQGDMARTLNAPANQLRVLSAQLEMAGRAIGNIFIPALNAILPYAIAVVNAFRSIAEAIATAFGFEMPTVDYSSVTEATTAMETLEETTTGTGKAAKKAKELLADWDELNIIASESGSGSGTGKTQTPRQPDDWTWQLPEYDFLGNAVESRAKGIRDALEPLVQWIKDNLDLIQNTVTTIGSLFLAWSVSKPFIGQLFMTNGFLKSLAGYAASAIVVTISALLTYKLTNDYLNSGDYSNLVLDGLNTVLSSALAGALVYKASGGNMAAGLFAAAVTLTISAGVQLGVTYNHIKENGLTHEAIVTDIAAAVKGAAAGGLFAAGLVKAGVITTMSAAAAAGMGALIGFGVVAAVAVVLAAIALDQKSIEDAKQNMDWGELELTAEEVKAVANALFDNIQVHPNIILANNTVESLNNAKALLEKQLATFSSKLKLIKLGVNTNDSYQGMLDALTGGKTDGEYTEESLLGQLHSTLAAITETVGVSVTLVPPTDSEGNALDAAKIVENLGLSTALIQSTADSIGRDLAGYLAKGIEGGLTDEEKKMTAFLGDWLNRINTATLEAQYQSEFETKFTFRLSDLDQQSFEGVNQAFADTASEMEASYRELATVTKRSLAMAEAGAEASYQYYLNDPRYGADSDEAKEAKRVWDAAKQDLESYDPLASTEAYMKSVRDRAWELVRPSMVELTNSDEWSSSDKAYNNLIAPLGRQMEYDFQHKAGDAGFAEELLTMLNENARSQFKKEDYESLMTTLGTYDKSIIDLFDDDMLTYLYSTILTNSSFEDANKVFSELGLDGVKYFKQAVAEANAGNDDPLADWLEENMDQQYIDRIMSGAGKEAGESFAKGMTGARLPTLVKRSGSNPDSVGFSWSIQEFAEGGQPVTGELFVAREAGPELVGSIGHKSTVMNNDQIVAGVANGVADGQAEQNELLRQQNAYLRIIAAKSGKVTLTPSSELGRVNKRSEEMRLRAEGV